MKIRTQLLLAFAGVTLVPLCVAGLMSYQISKARLLTQADRNLEMLARRVASEVDSFVYRAVEGVRVDGLIPQLSEYLDAPVDVRARVEPRMRQLLINATVLDPVNVTSCALFDRNGRKVHETAPDLRAFDETGRSWVTRPIQTGLPVIEPDFEGARSKTLWVGAPVRDADGAIVGCLRLRYEIAALQQIVARLEAPGTGGRFAVVVDDTGRILAHGNDPARVGSRLDGWVSSAAPGYRTSEVTLESDFWSAESLASGDADRVARWRLQQAPWWIAVVEPDAAHTRAATELRQTMTMLGVLVVVLGVLTTAFVADRVSRPLNELLRASARIGQGEFDVSVSESTRGEVGMLARAFNRMTTQLRGMRGALEQRIDDLRRSEERLDQLIAASPAATAVWTDDQRFQRFNAKFTEIFGYTIKDLPTLDDWWSKAYPDPVRRAELQQRFLARMAEAVRTTGEMAPAETDVHSRDGTSRRIEFRSRRVGAVWLTTFTDLTERVRGEETRRRLEDQLRQSQKLEAVGTLAGGIAHDFNNILIGILGNTQLALIELPQSHPARAMLEDSYAASLRARDLVARILTFARRAEVRLLPTPLGPVVAEAARLLRASLPANIAIETRLDEGVSSILCDPVQIHQIVMNLGANAGHAMPSGGTLALVLESVVLSGHVLALRPQLRAHHTVRLTVRDSGVGMDASTLQRLFEPFFTTKPVGEGTGLGLAVVHGILKSLGAAAVVESQVGVGTVFALYFSGTTATAADDAGAVQEPPRGHGEEIVVVDDEEVVLKVMERILGRLGYRCHPFTRAEHALEALRSGRVNGAAVISDMSMPGRSGLELARELRVVRPGLPFILATGNSVKIDTAQLSALGIVELVEKPFSIEEVAGALARALKA